MGNKTEYLLAYEKTLQQFQENPIIHWEAIWWIQRPLALWIVELIFAIISLVEALLVAYLSYKVVNIFLSNHPKPSIGYRIELLSESLIRFIELVNDLMEDLRKPNLAKKLCQI